MKTLRHIAVFPFEVLIMGCVLATIAIDLIGCALGWLCQCIEGQKA